MARILIIDDNESIRALLRQALEQAGHETVDASDGKVGVRLFSLTPFDLVITDIVMPEQEGIESIRKIRAQDRTTPIFAISGSGAGASTYLETASILGATRTFGKPFRLSVLLAAVNEVTRRVA
jgi:DNA-binding response OmpR family regulator